MIPPKNNSGQFKAILNNSEKLNMFTSLIKNESSEKKAEIFKNLIPLVDDYNALSLNWRKRGF